MEQRVERPRDDETASLNEQRSWVREHFAPASRHLYDQVAEKLRLLQAIIDANWIAPTETVKLQCLGVTLGDALAQELGLEWVMVEDEHGRDPALRWPGTTAIAFPLTMISKRIERGETIDVHDLFAGVAANLRQAAADPRYRRN